MGDEELSEVVESWLNRVLLQIDELAKRKIPRILGSPFYAHKTAKPACLAAVRSVSLHIGMALVSVAIGHVTGELRLTFCDVFASVSAGSRAASFPYFSAAALEAPLSRILRREIGAAGIQRHLAHLASDSSRRLLTKRGRPESCHYRLRDALIQPYVIMDGLSRGVIDEEEVLYRSAPDQSFMSPRLGKAEPACRIKSLAPLRTKASRSETAILFNQGSRRSH